MRTDLENRLFNYLKKNPKIILDSLDYSVMYYDKKTWKLDSVSIENEKYFECGVILYENVLPAISCLPIPEEFLRKEKLNELNKRSGEIQRKNFERYIR